MDHVFFIRQLTVNAERIKALLTDINEEESRWKPDENTWSFLEVINHLYDEEREDFRVRLDIILHHPDKDWPPIDPEAWVLERNYNLRDLRESLADFLDERSASLKWLSELGSLDWEREYSSPFGSMKAGDMLASWVTHDHLHMRQLIEIHRALTITKATPYNLEYAGDW